MTKAEIEATALYAQAVSSLRLPMKLDSDVFGTRGVDWEFIVNGVP